MPTEDVIDLPSVPSAVSEKIQTLRDAAADRNATLRRISEDRELARVAQMRAESSVEALRRKGVKEDSTEVVPLLNAIERHRATLKRLDARYEELSPRWVHASRLVTTLEAYVQQHAAGIVLHEGATPQLQNGETAIDGLERAARRTRTLLANRLEVRAAPFPTATAKKIAWEQLWARAQAAKPDVNGLIDALEPVRWPSNHMSLEQNSRVLDPVGLFAWLFPIELKKAIDREIDAAGDDVAALTVEQRIEKLKVIDGDLLASEREEASFAELAGVLPREDCDPRAVLQLAGTMPAPERED